MLDSHTKLVILGGEEACFVSVYNRLQVETFDMFASRVSHTSQSWENEVCFILLQLTNALRYLQSQGIEELPSSASSPLDHFVLVRDADRDPHYRVVLLDPLEAMKDNQLHGPGLSLSQVAHLAMTRLPGAVPARLLKRMAGLLERGSSMALGQVKSMLEYVLWGPVDLNFSGGVDAREQELQRWVDLERATVLNNVIRTFSGKAVDLAVYEEYHLLFLVQTCAKMLHEASLLFRSSEVACM